MLQDYQAQDAKFQLLYRKEWCVRDELLITDAVGVELVGWSTFGREDLVMTSTVKVDFETVVAQCKIVNGPIADAIDAAAKQYVDLLKAHPGYPPNNEPG